ncbi:MAG: flagellar hook-length control protein FliK [Ignavibacteriales bacterium]|nr:flagellar hook-length control protein FliK [Ignavibacteriales bacterium]
MNINTFFLDKLMAGEQAVALGSKKLSSPTNLFSDIIKVFEQESEQNSTTSDSANNLNLASQNIFQLPVNVIECNSTKLQALIKFIDSFMADPQLSVKATEVKHDLQSVVINKKQFLLSSGSLENFINGLVQNLGLNNISDLKTVLSQNAIDENTFSGVKDLNVKNDNDKQSSRKEIENNVKTDDAFTEAENIVQSLLQYLSENKSLSLSVKNGKDKLNINFYNLPEDNIETEFNLEKLSADFNKSSKEFNAALADIAKEQGKEKTVTAATLKGLGKNPADFNSSPLVQNDLDISKSQTDSTKPAESADPVNPATSINQNNNVYKTEVIEITFNPAVQSKILNSTGSQTKIYQMPNYGQADSSKSTSIFNNDLSKKEFELFDAGFRLRNNFAAQLNALKNQDNNVPVANSSAKTEAPNPLLVQQSVPIVKVVEAGNNKTVSTDSINTLQQTIKSSPEKGNIVNESKSLINDLKVTIEGSESANKNSSVKESVVTDSKTLLNDLKETLVGPGAANKNFAVKESVVKEIKVLLNDLNGKIESSELTKSSPQKDKTIFSAPTLEMNKDASPTKNDIHSKFQDGRTIIPDAPKLYKQASAISEATPFNGEKYSAAIESPKEKAFVQEVKDLLMSGMPPQKISTADEKVKVGKETDAVKLVSGENVKNDKAEVKEANGKTADEKESFQNKPNDNFKNILQGTEQTRGIDADKFKMMNDAKLPNEPMKLIKPAEIISEFSKIIQAGEKQSMTFQLTPENLGKVKLIVDLVNNNISTRIEVENDQVKQFIQSNIEQLKQNLQSSGVHLSNVNISLAESEQKFAKTFTPRRKMGEKISKIKEGDDSTRRSQKSLGYNTYEYLA